MGKKQRPPLSESEKNKYIQEHIDKRLGELGLSEGYTDLLRGIMNPLYQRKPIVGVLDTDQLTNPMFAMYEREMNLSSERNKKIKDYQDMDEYSMVQTALDIYASEACQRSEEHDATCWVTSGNAVVMEEAYRLFQQTEYEDYIEAIARDTAKFGDDFVGILYNFRDGIVRLKFTDPDEIEVTSDRYGRVTGYRFHNSKKALDVWNFVHYRNVTKKISPKHGKSVYGASILEAVRRDWRQLKMMEDALTIYRMDLGTRRMVFYVDVGNLDQREAIDVVNQWERRYKKRNFLDPNTGEFTSRHNPLAMDSHIFWPIRPQSRSRVDYIGGDSNVSGIADVEYMRRKLAAGLKIPMAYLCGDEYSAVRAGIAQLDIYFARLVKKLQRAIIRGTSNLLLSHLRLREVVYSPQDVRVNMEPISGLEETQRLEALTMAVNLAQSMYMVGIQMGIPPQIWCMYILKDVLRIADEDIARMPISQEQIDQVDRSQKPNGNAKEDLDHMIQEALNKDDYAVLKKYLSIESDADPSYLTGDKIGTNLLIPVDAKKQRLKSSLM